jgi:hypothetical protein
MRGNVFIGFILTCHISNGLAFTHQDLSRRKVLTVSYPSLASIHNLNQSNIKSRNHKYWRLTTAADDTHDEPGITRKRDRYVRQPIIKAVNKFKARPGTYLLIPCIAALVGW